MLELSDTSPKQMADDSQKTNVNCRSLGLKLVPLQDGGNICDWRDHLAMDTTGSVHGYPVAGPGADAALGAVPTATFSDIDLCAMFGEHLSGSRASMELRPHAKPLFHDSRSRTSMQL